MANSPIRHYPKTLVSSLSDAELAQAARELLKHRNESEPLPNAGVVRKTANALRGDFPSLTESMRLRLITDAAEEEVMQRWLSGRGCEE